ncbi:uncharacterized protein (DUF2249 family) [Salirhabdus euzebyi]|uniref:Uncharacterized protein (DUF2249 family) n=1 Tax=Salirhabdus euzebyi TaxID=394506 RepID=A0A841Q425_9BACI|nr:DUF2249 domain-containing protein [Salirhabdus euzebyi]MBB6453090.1 uncharacterized protein (DUF2249 family) [Salirhabdus euzebyi]
MNEKPYVELDVREDLRLKMEPFQKIMTAVNGLKEGQDFILHAPFKPVPLFKVLERKGFEHESVKIAQKHWKVIFRKKEVDVS